MDLGNPLGGGSHTSTIHEAYIIYPSEEANFTSPSRGKKKKKKKRFSPCPATTQPMGNYYNSVSERSPKLQALIFL